MEFKIAVGQINKHVGITEIAEACGVSRMTVSRALRHDPAVIEETRNRVLQFAKKMGYHPKARVGRPKLTIHEQPPVVDVVMSTGGATADMFYAELLISIEQELSVHGYDCMIRTTSCGYSEFLWLYQALDRSRPAGTLIVGYMPVEQLSAILALKPDAILVDHSGDPRLTCAYCSVSFDYVGVARQAVRHLLACDRQRILLIKSAQDHFFSRDIEQGYRESLATAGIDVDPRLICCADSQPHLAAETVGKLLDRGVEFDAVFTNDEMALGVLRRLHERRVACPKDVAVIGCDGLRVGEFTVPALTTIKLDYRNLGRAAVKKILERREGEPAISRIQFQPDLVVRESTPPLKSR